MIMSLMPRHNTNTRMFKATIPTTLPQTSNILTFNQLHKHHLQLKRRQGDGWCQKSLEAKGVLKHPTLTPLVVPNDQNPTEEKSSGIL